MASTVETRREAAVLAALALTALAVRLYFLQFYEVISADGISYVGLAKDFISGRGLTGASHYPPFFPILLGLASTLTGDLENAGLAVSVLMGSLIVIPVYLLGKEFFDQRVGIIAALLSLSWPSLRYWSTAVMSQATYITLLLFGVYWLWRGYRRSALLPAALAGASFACAHLTRSEGVLVFLAQVAVLLLFTLVRRLPPGRLLPLAVSVAVFALVFSPYAVMLHELTGKWSLTGKSKIAIADALSMYLDKPDIKHDPAFQEIGYLDLFRLYPDYIRTNWLKNLATCWKELLPVYGWLLAALGFVIGSTGEDKLLKRAYLAATFAPLGVIIVFFFIGPEYTQAYLPVLFLCIGNGMTRAAAWTASALKNPSARTRRLLEYTPLCLALLYSALLVVREVPADRNLPYDYTRDGGRLDDKHIGLRLSQALPQDAVLITRSGRIGFYSGRRYLMPPQTDYNGIIDFARKNRADYLIATAQLLNARPQLEFLYGPILAPGVPFAPPAELELVAVAQEPGGLPYIVYRIKR